MRYYKNIDNGYITANNVWEPGAVGSLGLWDEVI